MSELHDIIAELKSKVAGTYDVVNLSIVLGTFFQSLATANEFFAYVRTEMLGLPEGETDGTVEVDVILPSIWPTGPTDTVARLTLEAGERSAYFEIRRAMSGTTGSGFMLPSKPVAVERVEGQTGCDTAEKDSPLRSNALKARSMRGYQPQMRSGMFPQPPGFYPQLGSVPQHSRAYRGAGTNIELIFRSLDEVQHIFDMVLACKPNQTEDIGLMREWIDRTSVREGNFFAVSVQGNVSKVSGELQGVFKVMRGVESGSMPGATFEVLLSNFHPFETAIKA
jgi:hypothetical protein